MLPSHYTGVVDGAGIGKISLQKRKNFFNLMRKHIQDELMILPILHFWKK
jgi:hypothetical protein